jgi:hypothetical protein
MKMAPTPIGPKEGTSNISDLRAATYNSRLTEPSNESGFPDRLDVGNPSVKGQDHGQAPQKKDTDDKHEQAPDRYLRRQHKDGMSGTGNLNSNRKRTEV